MRTVDLIQRKRDGEELVPEELIHLVEGYTSGRIPDYQLSAFLMAVFFSGMTDSEVSALTDCMLRSGETIDLSAIPGVTRVSSPNATSFAVEASHDVRDEVAHAVIAAAGHLTALSLGHASLGDVYSHYFEGARDAA